MCVIQVKDEGAIELKYSHRFDQDVTTKSLTKDEQAAAAALYLGSSVSKEWVASIKKILSGAQGETARLERALRTEFTPDELPSLFFDAPFEELKELEEPADVDIAAIDVHIESTAQEPSEAELQNRGKGIAI